MLLGLGVAAAGIAGLACVWRSEQRRVGARRGRLFGDCAGLLDAVQVVRDGLDFPVLRGHYGGHGVELRPIADMVALRKLPALWLQVTLTAPTGAPGILDVLLRPLGVEFWSPAAELPVGVATPPELPATAQVRADGKAAAALLPALLPQTEFLARPTTKEILIAPSGVRLVVQLAEGERGAYLLFRDAQFPVEELATGQIAELLDRAVALLRDVQKRTRGRPALDAAA